MGLIPIFSKGDVDLIDGILRPRLGTELADRIFDILSTPKDRGAAADEGPAPVFSTHKDRADYFLAHTTYPDRDMCPGEIAKNSKVSPDQPLLPRWEEVGPLNIGGRLTSLVVDPRNPDVIFAGSAGGGVWKSTDGGANWLSTWSDQADSLAIGALAIDPSDPDVLYCGTGEANLSADNYSGTGLFRLRGKFGPDNAWTLVGQCQDVIFKDAEGAGPFVRLGLPRRIGCIAVDPFDSNHILLGGVTHTETENAGLFETTDRGATWRQAGDANVQDFTIGRFSSDSRPLFVSPLNYFCHAVVFHPQQRGLVLATVEARGTQSGIWISRDGASSWTHAETGISGDQFGRTSLAVSPVTGTIYALASEQGTRRFLAILRSDDFGASWVRLNAPELRKDGQLSYTNCIAVSPTDPRTVIAGSLNLHKSVDGGVTWRQISNWKRPPSSPQHVHEDHHAIVIAGQRIYDGNDGGFAYSPDLGETWKTTNRGLAAALVYGVDVAAANSDCVSAGLQDLGLWFKGPVTQADRLPGAVTDFRQVIAGDGGVTCYHPENETHIFTSSIHINLNRHLEERGWDQIGTEILESEKAEVWQAVLALEDGDGPRTQPRALYVGSHRLWQSLDGGLRWSPVSAIFDGSIITAIRPASEQIVYVGTANGGLYRTKDACSTWSRNLAGPLSPGRMITCIRSAPDDAEILLYTTGGVGAVVADFDQGLPEDAPRSILRAGLVTSFAGRPALIDFSHLYQSVDAGDTWQQGESGLPNVPHNAAVIIKSTGARFVAHDLGVHSGGGLPIWVDVSGNLPRIRVTGLAWHRKDGWIYASTYGRGIWRILVKDLDEFSLAKVSPAPA